MGRSPVIATRRTRAAVAAVLLAPLLVVVGTLLGDSARAAVTLPGNFQQRVVFNGLTMPTNLAFSPDGRVFVAEKSGLIKVFASLNDTSDGTVYADLRGEVENYWDRGLLGLALHPNFPADPRVYVLYTYNADIGGSSPKWPSGNGGTDETCPDPPGATKQGCAVSARLSVLSPAAPGTGTGAGGSIGEQVLVEDWCQQFPSHSIGTLLFGPDGMLYAGAGDGASFGHVDYGQTGNVCGDPPGAAGTSLTAPSGEGGALRAQDLRTTGDKTGLDGGIIRIDPDTGAPAPGNPLAATGRDANAKRLIAEGLRNPYRFTVRPGTGELWIGDVGMTTWEEIDRIPDPKAKLTNFGWPCYEGGAQGTPPAGTSIRMPGYDTADLTLCENLYAAGSSAVTAPYFAYKHSDKVNGSSDPCSTGSSSVTGLAFSTGATYPAEYKNALFFTDYSRQCIWAMEVPSGSTTGLPSPGKIVNFASGINGEVQLVTGPGGDLFGVEIGTGQVDGATGKPDGRIVRYTYNGVNNPPVAAIKADATNGALPLTVNFDAGASTDTEGGPLNYRWDLDGDGQWDTGVTGPTASKTYTSRGKVTVKVEADDGHGGTDVAETVITAGSTPPTPTITSPATGTTWKVGDKIDYSGTATDTEDGTLPAADLDWAIIMHHCPSGVCHSHVITNTTGAGGSFSTPDHEYPSWIELRLTATDSDGLRASTSVRLDPKSADLTLASSPTGMRVGFVDKAGAAPQTTTAIVGSTMSVAAPQPQVLNDQVYDFASWSDGGAATHDVTVPAGGLTLTAAFKRKTNLALKRPVAVSGTRAKAYPGPAAVDGSMSTRWLSSYSDTQWIKVDLGASKKVGRVILRWHSAYGKGYKIQTSTDGSTWTTVRTVTAGDGGVDNLTFTPRNARWVRMYGTKRATSYGYSLWEYEIYDG